MATLLVLGKDRVGSGQVWSGRARYWEWNCMCCIELCLSDIPLRLVHPSIHPSSSSINDVYA